MEASSQSMTPKLQKAIDDFSDEVRRKLKELHSKLDFTEHHLETFEANHGELNLDSFPIFQADVEKEIAAAAQAAKARRDANSGAKRARLGFVPSSLGAALSLAGLGRGQGGFGGSSLVTTPDKRTREQEDLGTPEPVQKSVHVTLKASLNPSMGVKPTIRAEEARVEVLGDEKLWSGPRRGTYAWMDESLEDRTAERDQRLADLECLLGEAMQQRQSGEEATVGIVGVPCQAETILCGRVVCEGLEGRLNERSMILEGSRTSARGARVQLNASACPHVAAFPGQLVAVLGRSGLTGTTFHARDFLAGLPVPPPSPGCEQLHMMVLAGPFCLKNGLDYSPLEQALQYAVSIKPQVLMILGPFVDSANKLVAEGDVELPDAGEPCTLEEFYAGHVLAILQRGLKALRKAGPTEVLLVPSLDEALSFHPMPQPPLDAELAPSVDHSDGEGGMRSLEQLKSLGVKFLPNPAHLSINGLRVSVTSADALSPVLRSGLVLRPEERKIEQALRLLHQQRSFFPVLPREPACVSEARAAALDFPERCVPDIMISPSASGTPSGTLVDGRLFVNPGSVCRPAAMGTFSEVWVGPPPAETSKAFLRDHVRVDIQSLS